jgi:hypothetical protein
MTMLIRSISMLGLGAALCATFVGAARADTYKCPGNVYNNTYSAKEAKDKGCKVLDNAPISVIQGPRPRVATSGATAGSGNGSNVVDPGAQRARDSDARRILEAELKREQDRLTQMKADYNNGNPDRQGNEIRNNQKYIDRIADMQSAITRKEGDIAALQRELAKYPQ